jgi:hypothetical protein
MNFKFLFFIFLNLIFTQLCVSQLKYLRNDEVNSFKLLLGNDLKINNPIFLERDTLFPLVVCSSSGIRRESFLIIKDELGFYKDSLYEFTFKAKVDKEGYHTISNINIMLIDESLKKSETLELSSRCIGAKIGTNRNVIIDSFFDLSIKFKCKNDYRYIVVLPDFKYKKNILPSICQIMNENVNSIECYFFLKNFKVKLRPSPPQKKIKNEKVELSLSVNDKKKLLLISNLVGRIKYSSAIKIEDLEKFDYLILKSIDNFLYDRNLNKFVNDLRLNFRLDTFLINCNFISKENNNIHFTESINSLTDVNKFYIRSILENEKPRTSKFLEYDTVIYGAIFENDTAFFNTLEIDKSISVFSFIKHWNIVKYFFGYNHLINIDSLFMNSVENYVNVKDIGDYYNSFLKFRNNIRDGHAIAYGDGLKSYFPNKILNLKVKITLDKKLIITNNYYTKLKNILRVNDTILKINNRDVKYLIDSLSEIVAGANQYAILYNVSELILRTNNDSSILFIKNNKNKLGKYTIKTIDIRNSGDKTKKSILFKERKLFINLEKLNNTKENFDRIRKNLNSIDTVVIDGTGYPNETLDSLTNIFFSNSNSFALFTKPSLIKLGDFEFADSAKTVTNSKKSFKGKILYKINPSTISQGEFTAMAFQTYDNVKFIGNSTAGTDGQRTCFKLPGKIISCITGMGVYYIDKTCTYPNGLKFK